MVDQSWATINYKLAIILTRTDDYIFLKTAVAL